MSCVGGLNQFLTANVPISNGEGADLDVSTLVGKKTIFLSGAFDGEYVVLGSHDDANFVPIASFSGQETAFGTSGPQTLRRDVDLTLKTIKVRRAASKTVNVAVAAQTVCTC
jgi:hypothetical protein